MGWLTMQLKIFLPYKIYLDKEIRKLIAEGINGYFCIKTRHIDFISALVPGLFMLENMDGSEEYFALNEGILVKCGNQVFISSQEAVRGPDLRQLKQTVVKAYKKSNEQEQTARSIIAKLEADTIRRFLELGGKNND